MGQQLSVEALQELTGGVLGGKADSTLDALPAGPLGDGAALREGQTAIQSLIFPQPLSESLNTLAPLGQESAQFGRDDLKHGEAGTSID